MKKYLYVLTSLVLMSLVSCVNEPFSNEKEHGRETSLVAALGEQVVSVGATVDQLAQIQTEIDNLIENAEETQTQELSGCKTALQNVVASLESHVDYLKGATWFEGTMATIECQKALASVVASLEIAMGQQFDELESSVSTWVGKDFCMSYSAALALARVQLLGISLNTLSADVTEGLIVAKDSEELAALSVSVAEDAASYAELGTTLDAVVSELTQEYAQAVEAVVVNKTSYDAPALAEYNSNVAVVVKSSTITLNDLVARVSACEAQLESILQAIEDLEANVDGLLGMIQSVAFISDYSSDYAVAYYEMQDTKISDMSNLNYGKAERTPVNTIELNYMIRPASVAAALTKENVSVFGYYANKLQPYAVNATSFIDLTVDKVEVIDPTRGLVKVVVKHNLKEEFYFKNVGAKCALSVSTGKTDFVSKFVEIVPKDNSNNVYVASITPSEKTIEIDKGDKMTLKATVYPDAATNKTYKWSTSNDEIVTINPTTGELVAVGVGKTTLTVTSNGVDEWGLPVNATVDVLVNEAVRLMGPPFVEVGKTAQLTLDFPASMNVDSKVWSTSDNKKLTVSGNGIVTAVEDTYQIATKDYATVTVSCKINNEITVSHEMKVVVTQPTSVKLTNLADDKDEITMKTDDKLSLDGSIMPENVDDNHFRFFYSSDQGLGWIDNNTGMINGQGNKLNPCTAWVYIDVLNVDKEHYFAPGVSLRRTVVVKVEPYYVKTLSFPTSKLNLEPNKKVVLSPIFTSDVDGKQPTYTDLVWESSNSSVVSVNATTGEISTLKTGTATITATVNDSRALADGNPISANCTIVVDNPVDPINIGDYFYSDGTWSTSRNTKKTVVGIVFSTMSAATADKNMMVDHSACTHGLVVGLNEYKSILGTFGYSSVYDWLLTNGYETPDTSRPNGYGLTKGMTAYRDANPTYVELYDKSSGPVAKHKVTLPSTVSSWYIPSYVEMQELYTNKDTINSKLATVGGTQITTSTYYWSSTLRTYNSYNECQGSPFDMTNGKWYEYSKYDNEYPVRVVFAF